MRIYIATLIYCLLVLFVSCSESTTNGNLPNGNKTRENQNNNKAVENANTDKTNDPDSKKIVPKTLGCSPDKNHEPPIGTGRGSTFFDVEGPKTTNEGMVIVFDQTFPPNGRPQYSLYDVENLDGTTYTGIDCIAILAEDYSPEFSVYDFDNEDVTLKLWLGDTPGQASTGPADIEISGRTATITTRGTLKLKKTKNNRTNNRSKSERRDMH